jgi:hypothetical protein
VDQRALREARLRQPFRPFLLKTKGGREFVINVPEHMAVGPAALGLIDHATEAGVLVLLHEVESLTYVGEKGGKSS